MKLAVALACVALAACTVAPVVPASPRRAVFVESEYAFALGEGTGAIEGQAFTKTRGGDVKYAAGNSILLSPWTSYTREWYERAYLRGEALEWPDPRTNKYARRTVADGSGRFRFDALPPGEYLVGTGIEWEYVAGVSYYGGMGMTHSAVAGTWVAARAKVENGATVQVIATR